MRISDWSSDVCSSDLPQQRAPEDGGSPHEPARHRHLNATRAGTPVLEVSPGEESMSRSERIAVIGLGYVGLPLAVALATHFDDVVGFDVNKRRVERLAAGDDSTDRTSVVSGKSVSVRVDPGGRRTIK